VATGPLIHWLPGIDWNAVNGFYFKWPEVLWVLPFLIPVVWVLWRNRRQRQLDDALAFSLTSVMQQAVAMTSGWRGVWQPFWLVFVVCVLVLAVARPTVVMKVPSRTVDMMLVMDISISMKATDMSPNRIEAARKAALEYIDSLPRDVRLGLVFFAGESQLIAEPTLDHTKVRRYVASLKASDLQTGTAIGSALQTALRGLAVLDPLDKPGSLTQAELQADEAPVNLTSEQQDTPVAQKVIVLMTDGDQQVGYPWQQAAANAKEQQVSIFTVGVGSKQGASLDYQGQSYYVTLNDTVLKTISDLTNGLYYRVLSEKDFKDIYQSVRERSVHWEFRHVDVGFVMALLALGVLLLAAKGSLRLM